MLQSAYDLRTHLLEWAGGGSDDRLVRMANRAVQESVRALGSCRAWSYSSTLARLTTSASYTTGTIAFDLTGGANERMVTLTGGTWPTDAAYGALLISGYLYQIDARISSTVVTLKSDSCPAADVAALTTYTWWRDTYVLPANLVRIGRLQEMSQAFTPEPVSVQSWLNYQRGAWQTGIPRRYCVAQDENYNDRLAVKFWPAPDAAYNLDYIYQRRMSTLSTLEYSTGTVSLTSASATVTGTTTVFTSAMVGAVFRVGTAANKPTDYSGAYPAVFESRIKSVESATSLTLEDVADANYTALKYRISDLLDIEDGSMTAALYRCAEWQFARLTNRKDSGQLEGSYNRALQFAKEADSRHLPDSVGRIPLQIKDMPQTPIV